jgi:uncharacterized protein
VDGLLHRSYFCGRAQQPYEVLNVGDIIDVEIIEINSERKRISLGTIAPTQGDTK